MANPQAVMRAASAGQKPMMGDGMGMGGGMGDGMPGGPAAGAQPPAPEGGGGMEDMVAALQGVGEFLQAQGPGGQAAMGHFQALLQAMAQMGGGQPEGGGESARIPMSEIPGTQVL